MPLLCQDEATAALCLLLFGDPSIPLPGNYNQNELGPNSPLRAIANFPQHLVLLGRATVMIKGIAKRLEIDWSLADHWKKAAGHVVSCSLPASGENMTNGVGSKIASASPCWSLDPERANVPPEHQYSWIQNPRISGNGGVTGGGKPTNGRLRFPDVLSAFASSFRLLSFWLAKKRSRLAAMSTFLFRGIIVSLIHRRRAARLQGNGGEKLSLASQNNFPVDSGEHAAQKG
mmetsp:Transcript_12837/g.31493  ORF Transcript_12837/g.31493 Transcript_12837/m.31493 type:complete len:231 (-) Transcript_12837:89-781(-)